MSEVLRAILDQNCIASRPAFYSAFLQQDIPLGAALVIGRRQARVQCKADIWFLCQGATQSGATRLSVAGTWQWDSKAFPSTFQITRGNTGEAFSITPQQQTNQNNNLNNFASLDDYILFKPRELIVIQEDVRVGAIAALTQWSFVTLMGVEYQMPGDWDG